MKEILVVFVVLISGTYCHFVHLIPAHVICPNVTEEYDILLPDPHDCSVYYKCINGSAVPQSCPPGLEWCKILTKCTLPIIANCTINRIVVTYSPNELSTYDPSIPPTPSPTEITCPINGGKVPNVLNCTQYYECDGNQPVLKDCPPGDIYSCWNLTCESADKAECIAKDPQNKKNCSINGERLPNPTDCGKYYECKDHKVVTRYCPFGKEFNPYFKKCYSSKSAHCQTNSTNTNPPHSHTCPIDGGKVPNVFNCQQYYECFNKELELKNCPPGEAYSCWDIKCEPADDANCISQPQLGKTCKKIGKRLPYPGDCSKYYECDRNKVVIKSCPNNEEYNEWLQKCKSSNYSNCQSRQNCSNELQGCITPPDTTSPESTTKEGSSPIPNPLCSQNDLIYPSTDDCSAYLICKNYQLIKVKCPPGLNYDCETKKCENITHCCASHPTLPANPSETSTNKTNEVSSSDTTSESSTKIKQSTSTDKSGETPSGNDPSKTSIETTSKSSIKTTEPTSSSKSEENPPDNSTTKTPIETTSKSSIKTTEPTSSSKSEENPPDNSTTKTPIETTSKSSIKTTEPTSSSKSEENPPGNSTTKTPIETTSIKTTQSTSEKNPSNNATTKVSTETIIDPSVQTNQSTSTSKRDDNPSGNATTKASVETTETTETSKNAGNPSGNTTLEKSTETSSESSTKSSQTTGTSFLCPRNDLMYPSTDDCSAYLICKNYQLVKVKCPPGLNYNCETKKCENITHCCATNPTTQNATTHTTEPIVTPVPKDYCAIEGMLLPNPLNCSTYYKCANGKLILEECPLNYIYSCWDLRCELPAKGKCIADEPQTGNNCSTNGQRLLNVEDCYSYYECDMGIIQKKTCPKNTYFNPNKGLCTKINNSSECITYSTVTSPPSTTTPSSQISNDICPIEGGLLPDPLDCTSYYKCENKKPIKYKCPNNEVYSCWDQNCLPDSESKCISSGPQENHNCSIDGVRLQNPEDCRSYYECVHGKVQKKMCPKDKYYNKWYEECDSKSDAHCQTNNNSTSPSPSKEYNICPIDGALLPNPVDCSTYYECRNETPVLESCPPNFQYSCWDQKCENGSHVNCISSEIQLGQNCSIEGQRLPNIQDCSTYYECIKGVAEIKKCNSGEQYNEWYQQCVNANVSHCQPYTTIPTTRSISANTPTINPNSDVCPVDGALLPDPTNCSTYFKCINYNPVKQLCANNLAYSCWKQECVPISEANCFATTNQTGKKCKYNGQKIQNLENCHTYYECQNGVVELKVCILNMYYNKWFGICVPLFKSAHCQTNMPITTVTAKETPLTPSLRSDVCPFEGGLLPNPLDCNSYYICKNNQPIPQTCPDNKIYSCWDQKCVPASQGKCYNTGDPEGTACSNEGERLPDPQSCSSYYECTKGKVVKKYCLLGKQYNKWFQECTIILVSHCQTYTTTTPASTAATGVTFSTSVVCPTDKAQVPNPNNCSTYFVCNHGTPVLQSCPKGYSYDCWDHKCNPVAISKCVNVPTAYEGQKCNKEGDTVPDISDCNQYYQCEKGIIRKKKCGFLLQYSVWGNKCMLIIIAKCANNKFLGII